MTTNKRQTTKQATVKPAPNFDDLDGLEELIRGTFLDFLSRGGYDTNNLQELTKIKHNTFDCAMIEVYKTLFKPQTKQIDNKASIIPYEDIDVLERIANTYISLCALCDVDSTLQGFGFLTGLVQDTINRWSKDELNPARSEIVKRIQKTRQGMIESKLSDHPIGTTALANNSQSLGMLWARNNAQLQSQKAVYIIPADSTRGLPSVPAAGENLPQIIEDGTI